MTIRDRNSILRLYYVNRYLPSSIARLYGLSYNRIKEILKEKHTVFAGDIECLICGFENATEYFIDGNENNGKPQNKIMLCEGCKRRIQHLQIRRSPAILTGIED